MRSSRRRYLTRLGVKAIDAQKSVVARLDVLLHSRSEDEWREAIAVSPRACCAWTPSFHKYFLRHAHARTRVPPR